MTVMRLPSERARPDWQPNGWLPPVAVGDEILKCAYCAWTCPRYYQNQTGPKADPPRDGNIRLESHVYAEHYLEHKKAKQREKSRRAYARKKALRVAL